MEHQHVHHGDYVTLYMEGASPGTISLESFNADTLVVFNTASPPNLLQTCVFQVQLVGKSVQPGQAVHYGDCVTLLHRGTKKTVAKRHLQVTPGHFQIHLVTEPTESCSLRLVPRFKLHTDGDPVRLNDQVLFECASRASESTSYLSAVKTTSIAPTLTASASKAFGIRVKLFATWDESGSNAFRNVLKGGDYVRLFHREANGFLCVSLEGTEPQVCLRPLPAGVERARVQDISTLWQVEIGRADWRGGRPVAWQDAVRLKSILTGSYLCGGPDGQPAVAALTTPTSGLLQLFDYAQAHLVSGFRPSAEAIPFTSFFYITSGGATPAWLHVVPDAHQGEALHTLPTMFNSTRNDSDAFLLSTVQQQDILQFYSVNSQLDDLGRLLHMPWPAFRASSAEARAALHALERLTAFCKEEPVHARQTVVFDLRVHEIVMAFASKLFVDSECGAWAPGVQAELAALGEFHRIARQGYALISAMCEENEHIGMLVARRHSPAMLRQCRLLSHIDAVDWDIARALEALYHDNEKLLTTIDPLIIDQFRHLLIEARSCVFVREVLELLASMCICHGRPVPFVQELLREHILVHPEASVILDTHIDPRTKDVLILAPTNPAGAAVPYLAWPRVSTPLRDFLKDAANGLLFSQATLLMANLCADRQDDCQVLLRQPRYAPLDELLAILHDSGVPPTAKAAYCRLLCNLYVDREPFEDHTEALDRDWDDIGDAAGHREYEESIHALFKLPDGSDGLLALINWIESYFAERSGTLLSLRSAIAWCNSAQPKKKQTRRAKDEGDLARAFQAEREGNQLTAAVLSLVYDMFRLGLYYEAPRREAIARVLLQLLFSVEVDTDSALARVGALDVVTSSISTACDILYKYLQVERSAILTRLLRCFHAEYTELEQTWRQHPTAHLSAEPGARLSGLDLFTGHFKFLWFEHFDVGSRAFARTMLALMTYHSDRLHFSALRLLTHTYNVKGDLLQNLKDTSIVGDAEEEKFLHAVKKHQLAIRSVHHVEREPDARRLIEAVTFLVDECEAHSDHSPDHGAARAPEHGAGHGHGRRPNALHQNICRHEDVHVDVLKFLEHHLMLKDYAHVQAELQSAFVAQAYRVCYSFLSAFCRGNHKNQQAISSQEHLGFLLSSCAYGVGADDTLLCLLTHNPHAVKQHVTEDFLGRLIAIFFDQPACHTGGFLNLLTCILTADRSADRGKQLVVLHRLLDDPRFPEIIQRTTGAGQAPGQFVDLLLAGLDTPDSPTVAFATALVGLLSACMEGNNEALQRAEELLPFERAAHIFTARPAVPVHVKAVFMDFLRHSALAEGDDDDGDAGSEAAAEARRRIAQSMLRGLCEIVDALVAEFEALCAMIRAAPAGPGTEIRHVIDPYLAGKALPFVNTLALFCGSHAESMQHASSHDYNHLFGSLTGLVAAMAHYLDLRRAADIETAQLVMEHAVRLDLSRGIEALLALPDQFGLEDVFQDRDRARLRDAFGHFSGEAERAFLRSQATAAHHSKHTHGRPSHRTHKSSAGRPSLGAKHQSLAKALGAIAAPHGAVEGSSAGKLTKSERIDDERNRFVLQVAAKFRGRPATHEHWISELNVDIDFNEFWSFVHIMRGLLRESLAAEHGAQDDGGRDADGLALAPASPGPQRTEQYLHETALDEASGMAVNPALTPPSHHTAAAVDLEDVFDSIVEYFKADHTEHPLEDHEAEVLVLFIDVLCAALTPDDGHSWDTIVAVSRFLTEREIPAMVLSFAGTEHQDLLDRSLRLGILLLQADRHGLDHARTHGGSGDALVGHVELAFQAALSSDNGEGQRALMAYRSVLEKHEKRLAKRQQELAEDLVDLDVDEENLDADIIMSVLQLLEQLCSGCNAAIQGLLRHQDNLVEQCDLLGAVCSLAFAYAALTEHKIRAGWDMQDTVRLDFPKAKAFEMHRELNDCCVIRQIYATLSALIAGPLVGNQDALVEHKVCDAMLPLLVFLQYSDPDGRVNCIDDYRSNIAPALDIWQEEFLDKGEPKVYVPVAILQSLTKCVELLDALGEVDSDCESAILRVILGLTEGRHRGDTVFDGVAGSLFPTGHGLHAAIMGLNLTSHYEATATVDKLAALVEEMHDHDVGENATTEDQHHASDMAVVLQYYMVLTILAEETSDLHAARMKAIQAAWDQQHPKARLAREVGRLEFLRHGELELVYYPIPESVRATRDHPMVRSLQEELVQATILLNPHQRLAELLAAANQVIETIMNQAHYATRPALKILSQETVWAFVVFALTIFLNICVIFELSDSYLPYGLVMAAAVLHLVFTLLLCVSFVLNHLPLDRLRFRALLDELDEPQGPVEVALQWLQIAFYWARSDLSYFIVFLGFSLAGIAASFQFFAFHLFDLCRRVAVMGFVIQAIRQNVLRIAATIVLLFMLVYVYMLIGRAAYGNEYGFIANSASVCSSDVPLLTCLRDSLYYGYQSSPLFLNSLSDFGALLFSLVYFISVVQIMAAVVSGIIIDSFGELRGTYESVVSAKNNQCFVCNYSRGELQSRSKTGFDRHIEREHNTWSYVYFFVYLAEVRQSGGGLNGIESTVLHLWDQRDYEGLAAMMPINRAMSMEYDTPDAALTDAVGGELRSLARDLNGALTSGLAQMAARMEQLASAVQAIQARDRSAAAGPRSSAGSQASAGPRASDGPSAPGATPDGPGSQQQATATPGTATDGPSQVSLSLGPGTASDV
eukprot:m.65315 g.65315  ORF g.65315 m.65315 type:complete len:2703 (-) comp7315_c0_seq2:81-8189(-)